MLDRRVRGLRVTGWLGVTTPGHSDTLNMILHKLKSDPENTTFIDVFTEYTIKCGLSGHLVRCCSQCGHPIIVIQCICLHCGMNAACQGTETIPMLCVSNLVAAEKEAVKEVESYPWRTPSTPATTTATASPAAPIAKEPSGAVSSSSFQAIKPVQEG